MAEAKTEAKAEAKVEVASETKIEATDFETKASARLAKAAVVVGSKVWAEEAAVAAAAAAASKKKVGKRRNSAFIWRLIHF